MSDVQYNEPQYDLRRASASKRSYLAQLTISWGLAHNDETAQRVLLVAALVLLALLGAFWLVVGQSSVPPPIANPGM